MSFYHRKFQPEVHVLVRDACRLAERIGKLQNREASAETNLIFLAVAAVIGGIFAVAYGHVGMQVGIVLIVASFVLSLWMLTRKMEAQDERAFVMLQLLQLTEVIGEENIRVEGEITQGMNWMLSHA